MQPKPLIECYRDLCKVHLEAITSLILQVRETREWSLEALEARAFIDTRLFLLFYDLAFPESRHPPAELAREKLSDNLPALPEEFYSMFEEIEEIEETKEQDEVVQISGGPDGSPPANTKGSR